MHNLVHIHTLITTVIKCILCHQKKFKLIIYLYCGAGYQNMALHYMICDILPSFLNKENLVKRANYPYNWISLY